MNCNHREKGFSLLNEVRLEFNDATLNFVLSAINTIRKIESIYWLKLKKICK